MKVKDLKLLIKGMPDNREVYLVGWDGQKSIKRFFGVCCNDKHQEKINELWFSSMGCIVPDKKGE